MRSGGSVRAAARRVDAAERTVGVWLRWYRAAGLNGVYAHRQAGKGQPARLSAAQQAALTAHLSSAAVYTLQDAVTWVAEQFGVSYQPKGMYRLPHRLCARPKVPRPHNPKSTAAPQEACRKGAHERAAGSRRRRG